jgi:hypothetical protein
VLLAALAIFLAVVFLGGVEERSAPPAARPSDDAALVLPSRAGESAVRESRKQDEGERQARRVAGRYFELVHRRYATRPFDLAGKRALRAVAGPEVAEPLLAQPPAAADVDIPPARIGRIEVEEGVESGQRLATATLRYPDRPPERVGVTMAEESGRWRVARISASSAVGEDY